MTKYTREELNRTAQDVAKDIRKETGHPAKVKDWSVYLNGNNSCIAVIVAAYDGLRQRNCAI